MSAKKDEMLIRVSSAQIGCLVFRKSNREKTRKQREMSAKKDEMLIRVSSAQIGCLVFRKSNHEKTRNERKNGTKKDMLGKISSYLSVSIWRRRMMFGSLGALAGFGYYYFVGCYSGTCPITGNPYISTIYGAAIGLLMVNGNRKEATKSKGAENGTGQTI